MAKKAAAKQMAVEVLRVGQPVWVVGRHAVPVRGEPSWEIQGRDTKFLCMDHATVAVVSEGRRIDFYDSGLVFGDYQKAKDMIVVLCEGDRVDAGIPGLPRP